MKKNLISHQKYANEFKLINYTQCFIQLFFRRWCAEDFSILFT